MTRVLASLPARGYFETMKDKGYVAYKVDRDPQGRVSDREIVRRFDPELGEIVMVPPTQGG